MNLDPLTLICLPAAVVFGAPGALITAIVAQNRRSNALTDRLLFHYELDAARKDKP